MEKMERKIQEVAFDVEIQYCKGNLKPYMVMDL